ncbi:MAG: hypothetical protein V1817_02945 [Candidatus Micrarchaeota archaeon]
MALTQTLAGKFAALKTHAESLLEKREATSYGRRIEASRRLFAQRSEAEQDLLEIVLNVKPNVYPSYVGESPKFKSEVHAKLERALHAAKFLSKIAFSKLLTECGFRNTALKIRVYHWHPVEGGFSDYHTFAIYANENRKFAIKFVENHEVDPPLRDSDKHNIYLTKVAWKEYGDPQPVELPSTNEPDYPKLSFLVAEALATALDAHHVSAAGSAQLLRSEEETDAKNAKLLYDVAPRKLKWNIIPSQTRGYAEFTKKIVNAEKFTKKFGRASAKKSN